MSIQTLEDLQPEPVELKLRFPASDEYLKLNDGTVPTLQVGGFFTKQYQDEAKKFYDKAAKNNTPTTNQDIVFNARLMGATIVDWSPNSFWDSQGNGKFTVAKMQKVFEKYDWMLLQLMEVLRDNRKFFRGYEEQSSGSTEAQSELGVSGQ